MTDRSESGFQRLVMDTAKLFGWRATHYGRVRVVRRAGTAHFTPVVGDRGAPDLILARGGVVLLVELKRDGGRLGPGQAEWAAAIGAQYRLWRPENWAAIIAELRGDPV